MRRSAGAVAFLLFAITSQAQGPPENGPHTADPGWHALVGGDVVAAPGQRLANATVVVRDGRVVSIVAGASAPTGARVWDCRGLVVYPGFVEPFLPVDAPAPDANGAGMHWNPMVLPQRRATDGSGVAAEDRQALRELGFAAAGIAPTGGVCKGTTAVVLLGEPAREGERAAVVREPVFELCSFQTRDGYPDSQMGAIALLRQTLLDADWYERVQATVAAHPELQRPAAPGAAALAALAAHRSLPLAFDLEDELEIERAAAIAREAGRQAVVFGSGMEFRRLPVVVAAKLPLIVPLAYPEAPDVGTLAKAEAVSLRQLASWEQAPSNAKRLLDAGCTLAWTTTRSGDRKEFRRRVQQAIACGVTPEQALAALTTVPARLLGVDDRLGTIAPGKFANLVVAAGDVFDPDVPIRQVWVGGQPLSVTPAPAGFEGTYAVQFALGSGVAATLTIRDSGIEAKFGDKTAVATGVQRSRDAVDFALGDAALGAGTCLLHARLRDGALVGDGRTGDGSVCTWSGTRSGAAAAAKPKDAPAFTPPPAGPLAVPFGGYGAAAPPAVTAVVVRGATLWPCDGRDVIPGGVLVAVDGRIVYAGPAGDAPAPPAGALVIEARDLHLTPGLIDCHSHTGISRGVNEGGRAVTAEVRVQDVVNPDDVGWYRELAGGVTTVNQLHGSANAIGGQSWTVKLRWGCATAAEMAFAGAPAGIKFALGENPRRANGDGNNPRYPNTRLGVEALIRDRFGAAAEYAREQKDWQAFDPRVRAATLPPRRDLELDALAEVLAGTRRIHCHSYRQDEIAMLCTVADEFGVHIGTFQHVLEGYKAADAIKAAGAGASTFSDWWAYKLEVQDAIPENGAILREVGVVVSFNSDSNELARRLNTEAGKAVKYGGVPPAAALAFVTLNPAQQLGIDARVGSLTRGKDADFVLWSDSPLTYRARCLQTWIDGRQVYTDDRDRALRTTIAAERQRLLQKALAAGGRGRDRKGAGGKDAYWAAEDLSGSGSCHDCEGGGR